MKNIILPLVTVLALSPASLYAAGAEDGYGGEEDTGRDSGSASGGSSGSGGGFGGAGSGSGELGNTGASVGCPTGRIPVTGTIAFNDSGVKVVSVQRLFKRESYALADQTAQVGREVTACVIPGSQSFNTDEVYENVRKVAYNGNYEHALDLLALAPDQEDPRILTYYGFTHRMLGDVETANAFYVKAIKLDPSNTLARSYYGQSLAERGHIDEAKAQLQAIADAKGVDNWPYISLAAVIDGAEPYRF
ncbi:MAG: tetratricopeptide repeat protein [Pseudomonadota bacterium]